MLPKDVAIFQKMLGEFWIVVVYISEWMYVFIISFLKISALSVLSVSFHSPYMLIDKCHYDETYFHFLIEALILEIAE